MEQQGRVFGVGHHHIRGQPTRRLQWVLQPEHQVGGVQRVADLALEAEILVEDVQIGVTHAGAGDLDDDLAGTGFGSGGIDDFGRPADRDETYGFHRCAPGECGPTEWPSARSVAIVSYTGRNTDIR